ncbi:MAG: U32 family peptidase, partial [Bacilli bacterium]|nr:U32 family peptidase [Bacilli bacterium]
MEKELLSPVGSMEALKMAIYHGADAIYLGGKKFGARAFAANFTNDEMLEAIFLCHLYGVRIYVTVNTMIYESELSEVMDYIQFLYEHHVDAIIMADIGLMKLCHEKFPHLEIHASTQVHTHHVDQIALLKDLGVKRVVLARELSLEEIKAFPKDIDIEVFIHGALCISYSGQCLFSSMLLNRSGNRGECAQICRLPFQLLKNGEVIKTKGDYLLSTKDLNTSSRFEELMATNIKSFKIEGRMKSPAYVGFMTAFYRNLMDRYLSGQSLSVKIEDKKRAETLFGRGFTLGKLFSQNNEEFMNQMTSNHQGSYLGDVEILKSQKVGIRLSEEIHQEDGIRFVSENKGMMVNFLYNEQGLLVSEAKKGELIYVDNKIG